MTDNKIKRGWEVRVTVRLNKKIDFSPKNIKKLAEEAWVEKEFNIKLKQ